MAVARRPEPEAELAPRNVAALVVLALAFLAGLAEVAGAAWLVWRLTR